MNNTTGISRVGYDSKNKLWEIYLTDDGWMWKKYEGNDIEGKVVKKSDRSFDAEKDCEADSKSHGMDEEYGALTGTTDEVRD